ncbi:MAG: Fe-S cluster assembly protein SufD [Bacteroidota bacterium]|nr:Fe-S cluster assembly protein SufD [Bacteroidota bacterium]
MSISLENKISTAQNLTAALSRVGDKNNVFGFDMIGEALQFVEIEGLPTNKHEEFKYCNVDAVFRKEFKEINNSFSEINMPPVVVDAINVYIINGRFESVSGKAEGLVICDLVAAQKTHKEVVEKNLGAHAKPTSSVFVALNTAYCQKGLFVYVEKNAKIDKPVYIHYLTDPISVSVINPRTLIVCGAGSNVQIIDDYYSKGANFFSTHTSEIVVGENAQVKHYKIQNEGDNAFGVITTEVVQSSNSVYDAATFIFSGSLVRNNHHVRLFGQNIEAHLNGLIIGRHNALIDNHTYIDHAMPNCNTNELYKGIAYEKSSLVFNGKIMVRRDAQKTNAYQSSKNILMSDDASIYTKPQLEIYADDVKCSHGTSTGKVDEDALFYLKARGIGDESARKLLLQAFAQELIDKIEIPSLHDKVLELFEESLK